MTDKSKEEKLPGAQPSEKPTTVVVPPDMQSATDSSGEESLAAFLVPDFPEESVTMEDELIHYIEEDEEESSDADDLRKKMYGRHKKRGSAKEPKPEKKVPEMPYYPGLLNRVKAKYADNTGARTALFVAVSVLTCLALIFVCLLMLGVYLFTMLSLCVGALLLILVSIALIVCGVAGLCFGLVMLFTSEIPLALIEIGLATIAFGVISALTALSYELIFSVLPRFIRYLTRLFIYVLVRLLSYVFGSDKLAAKKEAAQ